MSIDPFKELVQFLNLDSRIDLKTVALEHLLGLSGTEEGIETLINNDEVIFKIIELTNDKSETVAKDALLILVNVAATRDGAKSLLNSKSDEHTNTLELFVKYILNPEKKDAEAVCMILCNITRHDDELETCVDILLPHLNDLINVFVNLEFNKKGSRLHYIAPLLSNVSRSPRVREWLVKENPYVPFLKILPFCSFEGSIIRRGGAVGTVKNICFSTEVHEWLLSPEVDLLTYLLGPLMGSEDYDDDEMDKLPISLQYLPKEKQREADPDIRKMLLETINRLCTKRKCRELLRDNGVYYVLKELHKWEKDPKALLSCENVVDILIRTEDEIGLENITAVEVPDDMVEKLDKMDEDYLQNA